MARLIVVWLHVLAAAAWLGGVLYTSHLVVPALARGERTYVALLARARIVAWAAVGLLVVTGLENLRQVSLERPWVMAKVLLAIVLLALAAHRDFALVPRAARAIAAGSAPEAAVSGLRRLDRVLVLLGALAIFLGVGIARGR